MKPSALVLFLVPLVFAGCDRITLLEGSAVVPGPGGHAPLVPPAGSEDVVLSSDDSEAGEPGDPAAPVFVAGVDHPFLPLLPGSSWTYEGTDEGLHRRDEVRVLPDPETVLGIACTAQRQEVWLDGELAEVTTEWFASDADGNVWKFGEESLEADDAGVLVSTEDSWIAAEGGIAPWLFLGADPRVGDQYAGVLPDGEDRFVVTSRTAAAVVPAGAFENCLELVENGPAPGAPGPVEDEEEEDGDGEGAETDIVLYAAGVGLVSEVSGDGRIDLVRFAR